MISFSHDNLNSLYKLIERLIHSPEGVETEVIAGKLPESFPDDIPLPPNPIIIGSVTHRDEWLYRTQIFFDVRLEPRQLYYFYRDRLNTSWQAEVIGMESRCFVPSSFPTLDYKHFVNLAQNRELDIEAIPTQSSQESQTESITRVLLDIWELDNPSRPRITYAPLPILPSPPNLKIIRASGGNGDLQSSAEAKLQTALSLDELMSHYATYFEREGWEEIDRGNKENSIWRNWEITDDSDRRWLGVLQITSLVEAEHYYAYTRVSLKGNQVNSQ
ncbi:MAG: hypothetical protein QNJ72_36950 [Pleurocapsa sp. MO_226.B13]|nr:hypothetical protein [Pleurocapsa sp. MO_226.B13]